MQFSIFISALSCFVALMAKTFDPIHRPYDVNHYHIQLDINPEKLKTNEVNKFEAEVDIQLKTTEATDTLELDIRDLDIKYVQFGPPIKRPAEFTAQENKSNLVIKLPETAKPGQSYNLTITYTGKINSAHQGLFMIKDRNDAKRPPLLFTHFEALSARAFFPCNDQPFDKATTEISVLVPAQFDAFSNGTRSKDRRFKRSGESWKEIHWKMSKPHSTYLVSLAIGNFGKLTTKKSNREVSVYVSPGKKEQARYALESTSKAMEFFEDYLKVPYAWGHYNTIGTPTFLWGGMENTASTHMNEERTLLNDPSSALERQRIVELAAHELAHQWFGDLVTMEWWNDLWLNEAFASYFGTLASNAVLKSEGPEIGIVADAWEEYFRQEDGPRSHPIYSANLPSVDDAFDTINYTKGEHVLRMLNDYLGEKAFRKGIQLYLKEKKFENATNQDLFAALEKASGKKLDTFRATWILQRGYPVIEYSTLWNPEKKEFTLTLKQHSNHPTDRSIFHFKITSELHFLNQPKLNQTLTAVMNQSKTEFKVSLPQEPDWVSVNTGAKVLGKVVPLATDPKKIALQALKDPDPYSRLWAGYQLLSPLRDEKTITPESETALATLLKEDKSPFVKTKILGALRKCKGRWLPQALGKTLLAEAKKSAKPKNDGEWQYRAELFAILGKVKEEESFKTLETLLLNPKTPLDYLEKGAIGIALLGQDKSVVTLKKALQTQSPRGYRFQYVVEYAFGALENPKATEQIEQFAKDGRTDIVGRIGWVVADNQTLKNSAEWADFIKTLIIDNQSLGDEVKARVLHSIEEVKTPEVKMALKAITEKAPSERLRESSKQLIDKNF